MLLLLIYSRRVLCSHGKQLVLVRASTLGFSGALDTDSATGFITAIHSPAPQTEYWSAGEMGGDPAAAL